MKAFWIICGILFLLVVVPIFMAKFIAYGLGDPNDE